MNTQASRSQMEQGELISYETNLVACYEAEYLLSLQCKTNCRCSDSHSDALTSSLVNHHTGTVECNSWEDPAGIGMELTNTMDVGTRKRSHDENNHAYDNFMTDVTEQSMDSGIKCNGWYGDNYVNNDYQGHNSSPVITGQLSPHVKRMCFEAQRCQSY